MPLPDGHGPEERYFQGVLSMARKTDKPEVPMQRGRQNETAEGAGLTREATVKIGQQLRAMYDEVVKEGVPDRFSELLKRLDQGNGEKDRGHES